MLCCLCQQGLQSAESRLRGSRLTLRGIVEDIMLTEQLAACLDAEGLESTTGEKLDPKPLVNGCMAQLVRFGGGGLLPILRAQW
jgi:hypothetical protein